MNEKRNAIDILYHAVDEALSSLRKTVDFTEPLWKRLKQGRKILFKPTIILPAGDDDPESCEAAFSQWSFLAAVMRWFHDRAGISYYHMCLGAAVQDFPPIVARHGSAKEGGRLLTPTAVIEGYSDDFHGRGGFYFVRRYIAEASDPELGDDPLRGMEESMAGVYLPPGAVFDKLMVYDLNETGEDSVRARAVPFPGTEREEYLSLHKVLLGGDPDDVNDRALYPGSVVVNLVRLGPGGTNLSTEVRRHLADGLEPAGSDCREGAFTGRALGKTQDPAEITDTIINILEGQDSFIFHLVHLFEGRASSVPDQEKPVLAFLGRPDAEVKLNK